MGRINIVRPDGSTFAGTPEELARLQLLGNYKAEDTAEHTARVTEQVDAANADTFEAGATAVASGVLSGATVGLSDPLLAGGTSEFEKDVIARNPGKRLAGEIAGAIGASFIPGSPAGLVSEGAVIAGRAVGGGIRGAAAIGAIEGAAGGLQATIANATINNDPLTVESLQAGIGMGSLFGMGLGASAGLLGKGLEKVGDKLTPSIPTGITERKFKLPAELIETESNLTTREIRDLIKPVDEASYGSLHSTINEFSVRGYKMGDELETALKEAQTGWKLANQVPSSKELKGAFSQFEAVAEESGGLAFLTGVAGKEVGVMKQAGRMASKAIDAGDFPAAREALKRYTDAIKKVDSITGLESKMPPIPGFSPTAKSNLESAISSAKSAVETKAAASVLSGFPKTVDQFVAMKPKKAEEMFAALENVLSNAGDELQPLRSALENNVSEMVAKSGIKADGSSIEQLKAAWQFGQLNNTTEMITTVEEMIQKDRAHRVMLDATEEVEQNITKKVKGEKGANSIMENIGHHAAAASAASMVGGPLAPVVYYGVKGLMNNPEKLMGIKNAVQNRIAQAAKSAGKALQKPVAAKALSRLEPLYTRLDGTRENRKMSPRQLAKERITEISEAAPSARNILYSAVEPMIGQHPELASKLHEFAVNSFNMLIEMIPKDPGVAFSGMKSLWSPNPLQVYETAKILEAYHYPVAVAERAASGDIDAVSVKALQVFAPEVFNFLRGEVLANADFSKMNIHQQGQYSNLLDIPLHSLFTGPGILAAQEQWMAVPELPKDKSSGGGNSTGRPPKMEPPTPGQSLS